MSERESTLRFNRKIMAVISALLMAAAVLLPASPASAQETALIKVITANLGSGHDNVNKGVANGVYDGHGSAEDPLTALKNRINAYNPHVVTVQEACSEDLGRMKAAYPGWEFSSFAAMQPNQWGTQWTNACGEARGYGQAKGNFVMTRKNLLGETIHPLLYHDGRSVTLGCITMQLRVGFNVEVCNTHLSAGDQPEDFDARDTEAVAIRNIVNPINANGGAVVVTGDWNTEPKTYPVDQLHRVNRAGTGVNTNDFFWEVDMEDTLTGSCTTSFGFCRDGRPTIGLNNGDPRKLDYIFVGQARSLNKSSVSAYTTSNPVSHHEILHGEQTLVVTP